MEHEPDPQRGRIVARSLQAGFGRRRVLDLDLTLENGRSLVLLGPGGSGKTTLLRLLAADPSAELWQRGLLEVGGPVSWMRQRFERQRTTLGELLEGGLGLVSVRGRLRELWPTGPGPVDHLEEHWSQSLDQLPVGVLRLAELTLALARPSPILLLDEPTLDQTPTQHRWVETRLRWERGRRTLVLVTHHLGLARQVADEVALLIEGRIVEHEGTDRFFEHPSHPRTRDFVRLGC